MRSRKNSCPVRTRIDGVRLHQQGRSCALVLFDECQSRMRDGPFFLQQLLIHRECGQRISVSKSIFRKDWAEHAHHAWFLHPITPTPHLSSPADTDALDYLLAVS